MPDVNLYSVAHVRPIGIHLIETPLEARTGDADALKVTDSADGIILVPRVVGGVEDCLDVNNRCRMVVIGTHSTMWVPRGKYVWTVKGESEDIEIRGILLGHGSEVDLDLGNHSDQAQGRTRRVFCNVVTADGSPITWRRINATTPRFAEGQRSRKILSVPGFLRGSFSRIYALLKHIGLPI